MSDSFNPQELLSKLRAKSTNSTAASISSSVAPDPQQPQRVLERRNSGSSEFEQKSVNASRVQATKNIRAPVSLTLTPSQRQENLNARLELEREIKRLQDEVASLVSENRQLKRDKEDVEQQFMDFRTKNEDIVVKLRGKIAAYTLAHPEALPTDRGAGAGKMYAPAHSAVKNSSALNVSATRSPAKGTQQRHLATPQSAQHSQHSQHGHLSMQESGEAKHHAAPQGGGGFRDPTFSELMRRSTPAHVEFREALRRNGNQKLGTGLSVNPHLQSHGQGHAQAHGHPSHAHNQHQHSPPHPGQQYQHQGQHQGQYQGHQQAPPPPPPPHSGSGSGGGGYSTNNANNLAHAQGHLLSPSANNSNNSSSSYGNGNGSNLQQQRTKSLPNIGHSFGERVDVSGSHESSRQAAHPDGDHFSTLGYGSGGSGNNSHNGSVNQGYHYNTNSGHSGGHNGGHSGGHSGHVQSHNMDYLSTADTSDGEDIPVLEIDLSN